jgi:hypothetical protein
MIVIGVDVHKQSTAVTVDEAGRALAEVTVAAAPELLAWSASLAPERLWALEDCRQLNACARADARSGRRGAGAGAAEADGAAPACRPHARQVGPD